MGAQTKIDSNRAKAARFLSENALAVREGFDLVPAEEKERLVSELASLIGESNPQVGNCRDCTYFHPHAKYPESHSQCRRLSQRLCGDEHDGFGWDWAYVLPDDGCGEFRPKEAPDA